MQPGTMACVAYIAARWVSGAAAIRILDRERDLWVRIGGTLRGNRVALYDYDRMGAVHGELPSLFDECAGVRFLLRFDGAGFEVVDDARGERCCGVVEGFDVGIREHDGRHWTYRLESLGV
jgi:hypothetical protein